MNQIQTPIPQPLDKLLSMNEVLTQIPVSPDHWRKGVKSGRFPAGVKLGPKKICWRQSDITALIRSA